MHGLDRRHDVVGDDVRDRRRIEPDHDFPGRDAGGVEDGVAAAAAASDARGSRFAARTPCGATAQ